jgi:hypothetical protein
MSPCVHRHRRAVLVLVAAVGVLAPVLRTGEVDRYLKPALEEIARRNNIDPAALERMRETLAPGLLRADGQADSEAALRSVSRGLQRNRLFPVDEGGRLKVLTEPTRTYDALTEPSEKHRWLKDRSLAKRLIDSVSSDIRRRSILDEIGGGKSEVLTRERLIERLKASLNVPDFEQVADSFDHYVAPVVAKTLEQKTTLLRLYGGASMPSGRYFFCCRWSEKGFGGRWSDASGLATPPGNVKSDLALVTLPAGTTVFVGIVADNFTNALGVKAKGGNTQIFVPKVEVSAVRLYRLADGSMPQDIVIVGEDRLLRFRPVAHAKR